MHPATLDLDDLRLQDLIASIQQSLDLLKDYEEILAYVTKPEQKEKYYDRIQRLLLELAGYKQKYNELQSRQALSERRGVDDIINAQLRKREERLRAVLSGRFSSQLDLNDLRLAIVARFDTDEQEIMVRALEALNEEQLTAIQTVLNALQLKQIALEAIQEVLPAAQKMLESLIKRRLFPFALTPDLVEHALAVLEAPRLDDYQKLEIAAPIIPAMLSFHQEMGIPEGKTLQTAWGRLVRKCEVPYDRGASVQPQR